jgi:hypothetical protein
LKAADKLEFAACAGVITPSNEKRTIAKDRFCVITPSMMDLSFSKPDEIEERLLALADVT